MQMCPTRNFNFLLANLREHSKFSIIYILNAVTNSKHR